MSERYKAFIRELKRIMMEKNIRPCDLAKILHTTPSTVYYWLRLEHVINGQIMLEIIDKVMGGTYGWQGNS